VCEVRAGVKFIARCRAAPAYGGSNMGVSRSMNATAPMVSAGPQRMRALERANQARRARAELKRRVAQGDIGVAEVILTGSWEAERMAVADLLTSQRRWGHTRVRRFLASVAMSENTTIGSMTERPRRAVVARLTMAKAGDGSSHRGDS